jgi:hypothetical protein
MAEIIAALDEPGANALLSTALATLPVPPQSGSGNLGPFTASYGVSGSFVHGAVDLIAPGTVGIQNLRFVWVLNLSMGVDLNLVLPRLCLPRVCVNIPCVGRVCTPRICIPWPSITIPVTLSDFVEATADFGFDIALVGGQWRVQLVVQNVSQLQFGPTTFGMLAIIAAAATPVLLLVPFIGPFLAIAANAIILAIGVAGLLGLLGPIISPFVAGLRIPIYQQPQQFQVLPAAGPHDPPVFVTLDSVGAGVHSSDEDELVLGIDISA